MTTLPDPAIMDDEVTSPCPKPQRSARAGTYYVNCDRCDGGGCDVCTGTSSVPEEISDDSVDDDSDEDSFYTGSSTVTNSDTITDSDSDAVADADNGVVDEVDDVDGGDDVGEEEEEGGVHVDGEAEVHNDVDVQTQSIKHEGEKVLTTHEDIPVKELMDSIETATACLTPPIIVTAPHIDIVNSEENEIVVEETVNSENIPPNKNSDLEETVNGSDGDNDEKSVLSKQKGRGKDSINRWRRNVRVASGLQEDSTDVSDGQDVVDRIDGQVDNGVASGQARTEGDQVVEGDQSLSKPGLIRKAAVRRKGYNWTSKSMPRTSQCSLKVDPLVRKGTSLQPGSSLELAPSLLNIYDDIASSGIDTNEEDLLLPSDQQELLKHQHAPGPFISPPSPSTSLSPPTSLCIPRGMSAKSSPATSPTSPSSPPTMQRVPYRTAKLPSLTQPMDRPVSLTEPSSKGCGVYFGKDSKNRQFGVSSASASTSSLPRAKAQRLNGHVPGCTHSNYCDRPGCSCNNSTSHGVDPRYRLARSSAVTESHSSMDSGCVENYLNGGFDDISITSSSEAGSIRDDISSGFQDFVDNGQSPHRVDSNQSTQSDMSNSEPLGGSSPEVMGSGSANLDKTGDGGYAKGPASEESDIIKRMGSYIVRDSTKTKSVGIPWTIHEAATSHQNDISGDTNGVIERRRLESISRNEARKQFFSNYEERYSKLYIPPSDDTGMDYEELTDSTGLQSPPSPDDGSRVGIHETMSQSTSSQVSSPVSAASTPAISSPQPTSPSFSSHGLSRRAAYSRSSRKRESSKSGEANPPPSSPLYVSYVQRVVAEIVDSERTYISSLEDIIFGYLEPLEAMLNMEAAKDDIVCLFSNIREIYDFGKIFLSDLELTSNDPIKVAECFVRHNKGFVIYTEYCTNYPCAVEVLTRFMQHPELSELCKERQMALGHGLPLGAYLLKPVQRILKYHLLLQNIVKSYEKEKEEVPVLKQAFLHMTEMAHHINEMKRKHEHAVRIQEIQSQLEDYSGEDLTRLGELVLESTFRIYGAKASRQVFLFERGLLISKKKEGGMLSCKTFIKCSNLMLVEVIPNEPLSFHAIPFNNPRAQYTLQARNMEQKRRWCQEMKRLILESFKGGIPDNVKNLVMELGREHDDDYVTKEALDAVRKHQHTAPEYLEKRRVRRKSGSRLPDFSLLKPRAKKNGQRKEDKGGNRFALEPGGRRAESKSPEAHRRLFSKLIIPQARSQSHSLPNTPVTETAGQSLMMSAPNSSTKTPCTRSSSHNDAAALAAYPSTPPTRTSPSPPVSDLKVESPITPKPLSFPHEFNNRINNEIIVKRAQSFRKAVEDHPVRSREFTEADLRLADELNVSEHDTSHLKNRWHQHRKARRSHDGRLSDSSEEEYDDYVTIREDDEEVNHSSPRCVRDVSGERKNTHCTEKSESKSSSLPSLLDDGVDEGKPTRPHCHQSSEDICNSHIPRGRMSRRDVLNACGKRSNKNVISSNSLSEHIQMEAIGSDECLAIDKDSVQKKSLRIPGIIQPINVPIHETDEHSNGVKAKLTPLNSMEKLTKGSMTDLSHVHDDPWVVNAATPNCLHPTSCDNKFASSSSLDINSSAPKGFSSLQNLSFNSTGSEENLKNKENLDWLVYRKRNCLYLNNASDMRYPKRMSTSVLDRNGLAEEFMFAKKRTSVQNSPYATPPRSYMTPENMAILGQSTDGAQLSSADHNDYDNLEPSSLQNQEPNTLPRCQSAPNTAVISSRGIKGHRPYSLDLDRIPDERQLKEETQRIVAEMEDYISNTPSQESVGTPIKFPTALPSISVETSGGADNSNDIKRLSTVSSVSTSSYDSNSSDGPTGPVQSNPHSWTFPTMKKSLDIEQGFDTPLSSDEEDIPEPEEKTLTSTPKPKNSFEPPSGQRKSWQEERKLESVLRERSLGSESLGSRMAHAHAVPSMPEPAKSMPQLQSLPDIISDNRSLQKNSCNAEDSLLSEKCTPDVTRFSLPTPTEAAEAFMALNLNNCDIQQSDSGFSLQSNESTLSDEGEPPALKEHHFVTKVSVELKPKTDCGNEKIQKLSRHNSSESLDSTDSFYERRLSLVLNAEEIKDSLTIVSVYDDTVSNRSPPESPHTIRKPIREYVQMIEEKHKPQSPKVFEVAKREPGAIIRQRLESLRKNVSYGRSRTCDPVSSRNVSEERDCTRSKSQPPCYYRKQTNECVVNKPKCSDDIKVRNTSISIHGQNDYTKPRERVSSLSTFSEISKFSTNPRDRVSSLSKLSEGSSLSRSRDSITLSKSKESLAKLAKSKGNMNLSRSRDYLNYSMSLPKSSIYHSNTPGHEKHRMSYQCVDDDDISDLNETDQFVHRVGPKQDETIPVFSSDTVQRDTDSDSYSEQQDQQSSEVGNLVIMKGWVQALISRFQDK